MRKIKIDTPIYTIRNKQMMADFGDNEKSEIILAEMINYVPTTPEEVFEKFKDWQVRLKATERKPVKVKDYFLTVLGSKIETRSPRENIWVRTLSVKIEGAKNEIEISEDEYQFLKKTIEKNKAKRISMDGKTEEVELFFPYELGQLLIALEDRSEEIKSKK